MYAKYIPANSEDKVYVWCTWEPAKNNTAGHVQVKMIRLLNTKKWLLEMYICQKNHLYVQSIGI